MILLSYSDGETTHQCDARCYDAAHDNCDCVCGGMNHGAGIREAIDNTCAHFDPDGKIRQLLLHDEEYDGIYLSEMDIQALYQEAGRELPEKLADALEAYTCPECGSRFLDSEFEPYCKQTCVQNAGEYNESHSEDEEK